MGKVRLHVWSTSTSERCPVTEIQDVRPSFLVDVIFDVGKLAQLPSSSTAHEIF